MKVAYALWACLTIAIVTSGHETAVETLDPEEVAVPVFKPARAHMHQEQPCCQMSPVPDTCSCYVANTPISNMKVEIPEDVIAEEAAKKKAADEKALSQTEGTAIGHVDPQLALKAKMDKFQAAVNVATPFLPEGDMGARVERKASAFQKIDSQYRSIGSRSQQSNKKLVQLEKDKAIQEYQYKLIQDTMPELKKSIRFARSQGRERLIQKNDLQRKVSELKRTVSRDKVTISEDSSAVEKGKTEFKGSVRSLKRAVKRSNSNDEVKEAVERAKKAKAADAKLSTAAHKAGDKLLAAGMKVKKAKLDKAKTKLKVKNEENKLEATEQKVNKAEKKAAKAGKQVKLEKKDVAADKKKASASKAIAKADKDRVKAGKKELKAMAKGEAKKAKKAVKDKKKLKKAQNGVSTFKSTVKALNDKEKSTAAKGKKSEKLANRDNVKVKAELRTIRKLRNREGNTQKDLGIQNAALKTELVKTSGDHKKDVSLKGKLKRLVAGETTRKETFQLLLNAEKELTVIPSKVKEVSDKLAAPIRHKCSKIETAARTLRSKVKAMTKVNNDDKSKFKTAREGMSTPSADDRTAVLARGGCTVTGVDNEYVIEAFKSAISALQTTSNKYQMQIQATAQKVIALEQQAAAAGKNATKEEIKLVDAKLGGAVEQAVKEEVATSTDQSKKVPGAKAAPKSAKKALDAAAAKEKRIASEKETAQVAQKKEIAKDKKKTEAAKEKVNAKLEQIKKMDSAGVGQAQNNGQGKANRTAISNNTTKQTWNGNKADHPDAQPGKALDEKFKVMLKGYVKNKVALCRLNLRPSMPGAGGTIEQKVKKHLNCHREARVKGEIKRRAMRVSLGARVDAMSACVKKAFSGFSTEATRLGSKITSTEIKLGGLKASMKVEEVKLAGCEKEVGEASKEGVGSGDVIITLKAKIEKLKNSASTDNDQFLTAQKKETDKEVAVKSSMRMHSAKLNVMSTRLFKGHRKQATNQMSLSKDEKKVAGMLKVSKKLLKESTKQKYVKMKIKQVTGTTNTMVSKGELNIDKMALKAKLDVRKVRVRKQKMKDEKNQVDKLVAKAKKAEAKQKADKKKVAAAKKKEEEAAKLQKKKKGAVEKARKKVMGDKKKIAKMEAKKKEDAEKIDNNRSKRAKESSKVGPLREKAKLAEQKANQLEQNVDKTMKRAKDQEQVPGKTRKVSDLSRKEKVRGIAYRTATGRNKKDMDNLKFAESKLKKKAKQVRNMNSLINSYSFRRSRMQKKSAKLQESLRTIGVDKVTYKVAKAKQESIKNAIQLSREKLGTEIKHDKDELADQVRAFGHSHDESKAEAARAERMSSRLLIETEHDHNKLAAHKDLLVGELSAETDLRKHAVDANANETTIEKAMKDENSKALDATVASSTLADSEASTKTKIQELRKQMQPAWTAQQLAKQADGQVTAANVAKTDAQEALTTATKDLKHKAADRAFAEKIGVEHLTGHVQGALLEAARASHSEATKALAKAEKGFKKASGNQKAAAAASAAAHKKASPLTQESAASAKELADATASLIATTSKLRESKVDAILKRHLARQEVLKLKDAKEFAYEIHKNATKAESIVNDQQAEIKQLQTKNLLDHESLRKESSKASEALAGATEYGAREVSGKDAIMHVAKLNLPTMEEAAGLPDFKANLTAAAKAAVEKASQEAAVATQNAEDAHGALDSAVQSQTAAHTIARLKQKVEQLTKEKPKGTADIKAKRSQMRQLRRDQNNKKKEARKAKSTSKKLAKKSEKEYAKTQNEISQLSGKIAKAKGNYEAAQKEEDAANKQAEENENNVAKKATATIQAQEKLEDVTKASDQLSKVKDSDVDVPHMRL